MGGGRRWAAWERRLPPSGVGWWDAPLGLVPRAGEGPAGLLWPGQQGPRLSQAPATGDAQKRGLSPQIAPRRPILHAEGAAALGRPEERGTERTGEQRRGELRGVARAGPSGCLPIWKQYRVMQAVQRGLNSAARNMDLMGNRTSSQENPDSSPGLHPALGSPGAQPSQARQRPWPWPLGPGRPGPGPLFSPRV